MLDGVVGWGILLFASTMGAVIDNAAVTVVILLVAGVGAIIWWIKLMAQGYTPGKKILGLRVLTTSGTPATLRTMVLRDWIGKYISGVFLGLGYFWALFDRDRQSWHDKLATTVVVRE